MGENIFTTQVPATVTGADDTPTNLGTLFIPSVDGQITAIRWYSPSTASPVVPIASLWRFDSNTAGTRLAVLDTTGKVTIVNGGWNAIPLDAPVSVTAGQRYVAGVRSQRYAYTNNFFAAAVVNGHLTAPADQAGERNGRFRANDTAAGFPDYPNDSFISTCYFVDVDFTPAGVAATQGIWGVSR